MKHARRLLLASALLLASVPGCQETGYVTNDAGTTPPGEDAGPPAQRSLTYTPEGCGYTVSTPDVDAASMHEATFGDPATAPDHVHVSWAGPPESTFAVNWRSDLNTRSSLVLVGTDEAAIAAADGAADGVRMQAGHTMLYAALGGRSRTRVHEAHVCGLEPDTTYFYKVGGPGHWSTVRSVSTAPMPGSTEPFTFGVSGDSRGFVDETSGMNVWAMSQRRLRDRGVDFELFSGDAVILGPAQDQWNGFFESTDGMLSVEDVLATTPFMPTNGNHDQLAVPFLAQFALPQQQSDGETAQGEEWYSFDYANAHFIVLNDTVMDSAVLGGSERAWLEADLRAVDRARTPWIFVMHHRPFYTCQSTHAPDTSLRAAWQPLFDDHGVDVVFTGHNHVYERSVPIHGLEGGQGQVAASGANAVPVIDASGRPSGAIYVVAAGVGAPLYLVSTDCPTSYTGQSTRNYVTVGISGRSIEFHAYDVVTEAEIDTFTYTK